MTSPGLRRQSRSRHNGRVAFALQCTTQLSFFFLWLLYIIIGTNVKQITEQFLIVVLLISTQCSWYNICYNFTCLILNGHALTTIYIINFLENIYTYSYWQNNQISSETTASRFCYQLQNQIRKQFSKYFSTCYVCWKYTN